jgi:AraC-like DNA-binding protein
VFAKERIDMIVISEERLVESPYIEWVARGHTAADGFEMRPAGYNWHLIFTQHEGILRTLVVGALEEARPLSYVAGAESLWIRFKVGTYLPHLPASVTLNQEISLPDASGSNFWLNSKAWDIPNFENVETFVEHLVRAGALTSDPFIDAALRDELADTSERTIRYRFQHIIGLRQNHIRQIQRAQRAVELLHRGHAIIDTAYELGYADQPHLTRSLKRLLGYTPRELMASALQAG